VKTENGIVLEFQHSPLCPEERDAREAFYRTIVWVVDGLRLKRDRAQFFASLNAAQVVNLKPLTFAFPLNKGALLRDWTARRVPVFSTSEILASYVTCCDQMNIFCGDLILVAQAARRVSRQCQERHFCAHT
jgi:hypothetical protein